jgi:hypothetical protein
MWGRLGVLLQRPSDKEIGDRANEIQIERGISAADSTVQELASEVDSLTLLLAEADLELVALRAGSKAQIVDLTRQLAGLQNEQYADADALEELARERDGLIRVIRAMTAGARQVEAASDDDPLALPIPQSVEDAVELARQHLAYVAIPESALENLDELDATPKYAVWASTIWTGLVALNEYAKSKFAGEQHPGFKLWCDSTGMWASNKLAMTESDTVQNRPKFSEQRKFRVSTDVNADGSIQMYSHLQIQKGGGDNIPRVYFYDDTDGATKMFHVGFIGPHYCVRNTRS